MAKAGINNPKTHHGKLTLFKAGGTTMAKKPFPFEKSKKDVEPKGMKEGSKKEEAFDFKQAKGMKCGGGVKKMARGGGVESKGKTRGKFV